jgi:hypothetical protein
VPLECKSAKKKISTIDDDSLVAIDAEQRDSDDVAGVRHELGAIVRVHKSLFDAIDEYVLVLAARLLLFLDQLLLIGLLVHSQVPAEGGLALEWPVALRTLQLAGLFAVRVVQVLGQPPVRLELRVANVTP